MVDTRSPGERLREARKARGFSADSLAHLIGIAASAVRNHENGTNGFSATRASEYGQALGVEPQWLLFGDAEADRPDWWLNVTLPRGEYIMAITAWAPDDAVLVTCGGVYRATRRYEGGPPLLMPMFQR